MEILLQPEVMCLSMFLAAVGLLLLGFPVAFTLAGTGLLFAGLGSLAGVFDLSILTAFPQRILATMTNEVLVAVPLFVFMGVMLERSEIAEELLDNMGRLFGPLPGGLAYSVCLVGALLAASTGIVGATVITMSLISLPTMLRRGYDRAFSCGSIAAAGTLGQIIPPSIVLVLLGDQLTSAYQKAQFEMGIFAPDTVSVNDLFAGALFPGLMLVGMYVLYQIYYAIAHPDRAPPIPPRADEVADRAFWLSLAGSLFAPLLLIVAVLGSILAGLASPTEAAAVGAVGATMMAGYRASPKGRPLIALGGLCLAGMFALTTIFDLRAQRDVISTAEQWAINIAYVLAAGLAVGLLFATWRTFEQRTKKGERVLHDVMRQTVIVSSMVFIILVGASMFSLVFRGFGGDVIIEDFLKDLPGGTFAAVLLVMAVMFLLGFFLDFLEIVFIVVPIVSPILLQLDMGDGTTMNPVWLGVMMGVNLQTSFLTPPFGFALFYLRGAAPAEVRTIDIYRGIIPFVAIQVLGLAVLWYFPAIATWLPLKLYGP